MQLKSRKPLHYTGPALFLIALGIGNAIVGELKQWQYDQVYTELQIPRSKSAHVPPVLSRLQAVHEIEERHTRNELEATERKTFYRTVSLGGRLMAIAGFFLLAVVSLWRMRLIEQNE